MNEISSELLMIVPNTCMILPTLYINNLTGGGGGSGVAWTSGIGRREEI